MEVSTWTLFSNQGNEFYHFSGSINSGSFFVVTTSSYARFTAYQEHQVMCTFTYHSWTSNFCSVQPGRHPCIWCVIKSADMKIPLSSRGAATKRTVQGIKDDHQRFLEAGGDIKKAKEFNNCILEPLFDIPLSQVWC